MYRIASLLFLSFLSAALLSPMTSLSLPPLRSCSPMLSRHHPLTSFFPPSSSVPIHSSTYTAQTKAKKISPSHWVSSSSHSAVEALTFFFTDPKWHTNTIHRHSFYEKSIFTLRDCSETLLFLYFNSFALLCIHAAKLIQHVQSSGLRGILMEGVHSTTYCSVCLKCSTNQIALRPQRATSRNNRPPLFPSFSPSRTSILLLSSSISVTFSLINHTPLAIHPFLFLSLERKNKQLSGSGLQMNSKWLWRAEGPSNFL